MRIRGEVQGILNDWDHASMADRPLSDHAPFFSVSISHDAFFLTDVLLDHMAIHVD